MGKFIRNICAVALVGVLVSCAGTPQNECLARVASTEVAITESYETVLSLFEADIISKDTARSAKDAIDTANIAADSAGDLCLIDEPTALDYISEAAGAILKANQILGR